ncbi:hypothetical protein V5O48_000610 [Marasmius crinis-equi]|uniref:Protein CPL1-like domain-containing protein n=1 Tax=Marasmius crinis-equi TaxID=585013 RepID=A0ABR3G0U2_9AGAR
MRLYYSLISTFLLLSSLSVTPSVLALRRRHSKAQGQWHPSSGDSSATSRSVHSRRHEVTSLKQAQEYCGSMQVCGSRSGQGFDCVDTSIAVDSCGGCSYPSPWEAASSGKDCATANARKVACKGSRCIVDSCEDGFKPNGARDACIPAGPQRLDLRPKDSVTSRRHPLVAQRSTSCSPPPAIPDIAPVTLDGLFHLMIDLTALGKDINSLGGLLSDKCGCHEPPHTPHDPSLLLKTVVTLAPKVDLKLSLLAKDPSTIGPVVDLLHQFLDASDKCLFSLDVSNDLKGMVMQLKGLARDLLKGVELLPDGIASCGCKDALISRLRGGLKRASGLRRGAPCARMVKRESAIGISLSSRLDLGSLDDLVNSIGGAVTPQNVQPTDSSVSGPSNPAGTGPCTGSDGQPDPAAPVDVDLTCLGLLGITGDVVVPLGDGLNKPLNEVLHVILGDGEHPANIVHPCLKCCGGDAGSSDPSTSPPTNTSPPTSPPSNSGGSPGGDPDSTGPCIGSDGQPDPTAPVDVDLTCLGLLGITGDVVVPLGDGLNQPLNNVLHALLGNGEHPANIHPCMKCSGSNPGSGSGSDPSTSSPPTNTGPSTSPPSNSGGSPGDDSGSTGPCIGSDGQPDPTAPVDVDLTCLGLLGITGDVVVPLGDGLNQPLNNVLHALLGNIEHPANVHPCMKCSGGGSGPGSGTGAGTASPPTSPPSSSGGSGSDPVSTGPCIGSDGQPDPTAPVDVDLTCLGLLGITGDVVVPLGDGLNQPLNNVLHALLGNGEHPANIHPCMKCSGGNPGSGSGADPSTSSPPTNTGPSTSPPSNSGGSPGGDSGSTGPCIGSDGQPDPTAPVDVDLTCLGLLGITGDVVLPLGSGLNQPLNNVLHALLGNVEHPANVHPCMKCSGGGSNSGSGPSSGSGTGTASLPTYSGPSTSPSNPSGSGGDPGSTGPCIGSDGQPDPTAPVDVDLTCLGLLGITGDVVVPLGDGLNQPLNNVLHALLGNIEHPANVHPCMKCSGGSSASGNGSGSGSGSGSGTGTASSPTHTPATPSNSGGSVGSSGDSGSTGPCIGSDGQPDPTAPVDVDLTCLGLLGITGDVVVPLGSGLNQPLNEVLHAILGDGEHPANIVHPCLKCSGGGAGSSGSGSGSDSGGSSTTAKPSSGSSTSLPSAGSGGGVGSGSVSAGTKPCTSVTTSASHSSAASPSNGGGGGSSAIDPSTSQGTVPTLESTGGSVSGTSPPTSIPTSSAAVPHSCGAANTPCSSWSGTSGGSSGSSGNNGSVSGGVSTSKGSTYGSGSSADLPTTRPPSSDAGSHSSAFSESPCTSPSSPTGTSGGLSAPPGTGGSETGGNPTQTDSTPTSPPISSIPSDSPSSQSTGPSDDGTGETPCTSSLAPTGTTGSESGDPDSSASITAVHSTGATSLTTGANSQSTGSSPGGSGPSTGSPTIHPTSSATVPQSSAIEASPCQSDSESSTTVASSEPSENSNAGTGGGTTSNGPCLGSDGEPDLDAPVDVDLTCLKLLGITGDIVLPLGPLNRPLNEILHALLGDGEHPANLVHPCIKCSGGGNSGSSSGSASLVTTSSPQPSSGSPVSATPGSSYTGGPSTGGYGSSCHKCSGGRNASHAVST